MNKKDIRSHKEVARQMEWCNLANTIIDLELEIMEFADCLTKSELSKYHKLLKIYEDEKNERLAEKTSTYSPWQYQI